MDHEEFREILTAFADKPADIDMGRGELILEIRDDIIEAKVSIRSGDLWVEEDGARHRASDWIVKRIARLPLLADRVLDYVTDEPYFIEPAGHLLERMEDSPDDTGKSVKEVTPEILKLLDQRPAGMSTVLYLTSDAGEGKTTLIEHMARHQAVRYKQKETDWLIVPIALGGRPFLRLEDVTIATLVNQLRFPFLYYDAFVRLVRLGAIIPALDGFEEMFIEGQAGDAVSSLGNLMQQLHSQGTVIIAARKAFFEYKSLRAQAQLFDSIREEWVNFARIGLSRWDRNRFIEYADKHEIDGKGLFDEFARKLDDESHPLLTRAVLAKRLIEVASDGDAREDLIESIHSDGKHYFERFVESIVSREARQKWIDRSGEPAGHLLTVQQHLELLTEIALEMWVSETAVLRADMFHCIADLYAESRKMETRIANQIRNRITQHALIAVVNEKSGTFRFDHEEFYHYFLGKAVACMVTEGNASDIRRAFRIARFPALTLEVAARSILDNAGPRVIDMLNDACATELGTSFVKENSSDLVIRLIDAGNLRAVEVRRMAFPVDSLKGRTIANAVFHDCDFLRTDLAGSKICNCSFEDCRFAQINLSEATEISGSRLHRCEVHSVVRPSDETAIYAPHAIEKILEQGGFHLTLPDHRADDDVVQEVQAEERLIVTEQMCRVFLRSTGVNENTFRQRLGSAAPVFFEQVLPYLKNHGVLKEVQFKGAGQQRRYRLDVSLDDVQRWIEKANGNFESFLQHVGT